MSASCYINEFRPLAETSHGRTAITQYSLPPFVDASCRREPDLESEDPSITALCREGHFAPHLNDGDLVAYITKVLTHPSRTERSRRLVAVLRVQRSWRSPHGRHGTAAHKQAAGWYQQQRLPLPCNCMVNGTKALKPEMTDKNEQDHRKWQAHYWRVARKHGVFHACDRIFCDLYDPPRFSNRQLFEWFGTIPNPRESSPLPQEAFAKMLRWLAGQTSGVASHRLKELGEPLLHPSFPSLPSVGSALP